MATKKAKASKLESLEQADGRASSPTIKSLDQILGETRKRYSFGNKEEYRAHLKNLNLTDMQEEARKRGLVPIMDRPVLERRLVREFEKTASAYFGTSSLEDPASRELPDAAKAVLALGR